MMETLHNTYKNTYKLAEIAAYLHQFTPSQLVKAAHGDLPIAYVASLESAKSSDISFLLSKTNNKHKAQLASTKAGAVILEAAQAELIEQLPDSPVILCEDMNLAFVKLMAFFAAEQKRWYPPAIADSAIVDQTADLADSVHVGAGSVIGRGCRIGADTVIHANVTLYPNTVIGRHCIVHSGAIIGADGFGFQPLEGAWLKVEQLGRVIIGDEVEIGANTTIDRGTLDDTVIADGVKVDNQVHVAHNVKIGRHSLICGCVGIAGSARIGEFCILAGGVGISDNLHIADRVTITAGSPILQSIDRAGSYSSAPPTMPTSAWRRYMAIAKSLKEKLGSIHKRLMQLESEQSD